MNVMSKCKINTTTTTSAVKMRINCIAVTYFLRCIKTCTYHIFYQPTFPLIK